MTNDDSLAWQIPGDAYDKILATAYDDLIERQLNSPIHKLWAGERAQREASLSRAYKFRRALRRCWTNSRYWLSNVIYKHEESDW